MPAYSRILLPWDSQPQEPAQLNPDFPAIAGFIGGFGSTQNLGKGVVAQSGSFTAGGTTFLGSNARGFGVQGPASGADALNLHPVANQTNTVWERPVALVSVAVFLRRFGNTGGNSPIFGNFAPSTSPFTGWGLVDSGGTGTPQFQCSAGGYSDLSSSAAFGNNEDVVIVGVYDGAQMRIYRNGVQTGSAAKSGNITYPSAANRGPVVGSFYGGFSPRSFNGIIYGGILHDGAWSDDVVRSISRPDGFWQFVAPRSIWVPVSSTASGTSYTITPSGGITFAGTSVDVKGKLIAPTGGVTFAGTGSMAFATTGTTYTISSSGGITFAGTGTQVQSKTILPTGGITFSGSGLDLRTKIVSPAGGIFFGGTGSMTSNTSVGATQTGERTKVGVGT